MTGGGPRVLCAGCGHEVSASDPLPFSCANAAPGDDIDHLLRFDFEPPVGALPTRGHRNPFVRFRRFTWTWHAARARGLSDDDYCRLVGELDHRIAEVDGRGFSITPYRQAPKLGVHYKDETRNVAGSHKARHLMGIAIHLAIVERAGAAPWDQAPPLAIASCGNAALAAGVVAKAAHRHLKVFVPTWAEESVMKRLEELGAELVVCPRRAGDPPGDPCYHRFRAAVRSGALPFSCQGPDNGLTIDGGRTLGLELAAQHTELSDSPLSRLYVQVGGGALASSTWQALELAARAGHLDALPALVAVQTEGGHPLVRAWQRLEASELAAGEALERARQHRSEFMWPWESEPKSLATGILDDETYNYWQVLRGLVRSGGSAVVANETQIRRARELAHAAGVAASATGAAGFAGLLAMRESGTLDPRAMPAVIFSGVRR